MNLMISFLRKLKQTKLNLADVLKIVTHFIFLQKHFAKKQPDQRVALKINGLVHLKFIWL